MPSHRPHVCLRSPLRTSVVGASGLLALLLILPALEIGIARAAWPTDPTVNLPVCNAPSGQSSFTSVSDGNGGLFVAWQDFRSESHFELYAQHILAGGIADPAWPVNGRLFLTTLQSGILFYFPQIVTDTAGGAVVAWLDYREGISGRRPYAQHILADGTVDPAWPSNGRALSSTPGGGRLALVSDHAGGAVAVWQDFPDTTHIYAQRVLASGVIDPSWPESGLAVCLADSGQTQMAVVPDEAGGAIVTWVDRRSSVMHPDIYAHHIQVSGQMDPSWPQDGRALCTEAGTQSGPKLAPDGAGGAIVSWQDARAGGSDVYAQHVLADGTVDPAWPSNGRVLCSEINSQGGQAVAGDGMGGAIVVWTDQRSDPYGDIYAQHVLPNGTVDPDWPVNGRGLCLAEWDQGTPDITGDGSGGAIVTWWDARAPFSDIYAQRVLANGSLDPAWPVDGRALCLATNGQDNPKIVPADDGGAIVTWSDQRNTNADIYAQRIGASGQLGGVGRVVVPPVTISMLAHNFIPADPPFDPAYIVDAVTFPGVGYTSNGFTATLIPGDTVVVRFGAPEGKKFVVHHDAGLASETFYFDAEWLAAGDATSSVDPHTIVFENLHGTAPIETYSFIGVGNGGRVINCIKFFDVTGNFEFTAIELRIAVAKSFTAAARSFGAVDSNAEPSWGTTAAVTSGSDRVCMEIQDISSVGVEPTLDGPERPSLTLVSSNPSRGPLAVEFAVIREASVRLTLHDVQGRHVATVAEGHYMPGRYRVTWNNTGETVRLPSGVYFLRYAGGDRVQASQVVIVR